MSAGPFPPKVPLEPWEWILKPGDEMYRLWSNTPLPSGHVREGNEFNPGFGQPTRFAFFGNPTVPVLYAGHTEIAAVGETILHDKPKSGAVVLPGDYLDKVMCRLVVQRPLRLAVFKGEGLWALGLEDTDVTDTPASEYPRTAKWAEAAHAAGFDGLVWKSRQINTEDAYVFFGDRVSQVDLKIDDGYARIFSTGQDFDWLSDKLTVMKVEVRR